jgi:mono/diheme cytochrome c family protein
VVVALGIIGFAYSGFYDVSASSSQSGIVEWLLSTTSHASIERQAGAVKVPDLDDEALVLAGVNDFNSMCIGCHGGPGANPAAMGQGLNPPAPDLAESAAEMTPAELFWVTKHGIRMTGMPAWGVTHDDSSIWPVVALLTRLPDLDEAGYQGLLASAEGHGHHAEASSAGGHSHEESDEASGSASHNQEVSHDHEDANASGAESHKNEESIDHGEVSQPDATREAAEEHDHSTHEHNG